ncbi:MAG TPA: GAF domain-containing protein, partial [Anaerolineales bacterium]|nr:GAF domain-containing protein [Anaerolineales bacterium]
AVNGLAASGFGIRDDAFLGNFIVLLAAGLLVSWQGALALSALTVATGLGLAYAEANGLLQPAEYFTSPYTALLTVGVVIVIFAGLMAFILSSLEGAITRTQANARDLESVNRDLRVARTRLEENQAELVVANEQLKRRAERIGGIASIAKTITVVQEIDRLLPVVVEAVSERFQFEHVGIYLLEESGQSAALSASSSDEGRQNLLAGNRVMVGSESLIGVVTDRGEPRVGHPTGTDPLSFEHTEARSLLALPLKNREIVIGALDIQSAQDDAFTQEDVAALQILADQIAIAIQNARSAERARGALQQAEIASRQLIGKGWKEIAGSAETKGYRYDGIKLEALKEITKPTHSSSGFTVPVRLRGQVIGRIRINPADQTRQLTEDESAMAEATAERVALALESSRLLEEAQSRAQREAFLGELSSKLGASYQLDSIVRDTVEELGKSLRTTTVSFQLVNPSSHPEAGAFSDETNQGNGSKPK